MITMILVGLIFRIGLVLARYDRQGQERVSG
jgi:hypothetical protein